MRKKAGAARASSLIALALAACVAASCADTSEPAAAPASEAPQEVHVTITDAGFSIPAALESEPVKLMLHNGGKADHHVYFAQLNDGVTEADIRSTLKKGPDALFPLVTLAGDMPKIEPMGVTEITMLFPEGDYIAIDPEVEGEPPLAFFEVGPASGPEVEEPASDYTIEAGDFFFDISDPVAGEATVEITNTGEQAHEVGIGQEVNGEQKEVTTIFAPPPGGKMWTTLTLKPGDYTLVCFFTDQKTGKQHVKLGMTKDFTVQ